MSTQDRASLSSAKTVSSHEAASSSLFKRGIVDAKKGSLGQIFERLQLVLSAQEEQASSSPQASSLVDFLKGKLFISEKDLQQTFGEYLKGIISTKHLIEMERTNEDQSRCDIIISLGPGLRVGERLRGKPAVLVELKSPKLKSLDLSKHVHQLVHYAKELLSKHVSVGSLPFILFNGREYFVGLAEWRSFCLLEITVEETGFALYDGKGNPNFCNVANLMKLLSWPGQLRPRRISVDTNVMYKLNRVIGYGASSVVYQAEVTSHADIGKPVRRSYPSSPTRRGTSPLSSLVDDENNMDVDSQTDTDSDEDPLASFEEKLNIFPKTSYIDTAPPQTLVSVPPRTPEREPLAVDPVTEANEKTDINSRTVVLKFSSDQSCLQKEIAADAILEQQFKVGWKNGLVYELIQSGDQYCRFSVGAVFRVHHGPYMIIGSLHRPLIKSVFGIPYKEPIYVEKDHLLPLLENLFAIHDLEIIHRDIRPANVLWKSAGATGQFILSDFGFAVEANSPDSYSGTLETASQRVLHMLYNRNTTIAMQKDDDLESFLKLVKMIFWKVKPPVLGSDKVEYCKNLFKFWMGDHDVLQFVSLKDVDEKRTFLCTLCRKSLTLSEAESIFSRTFPPFDQIHQ